MRKKSEKFVQQFARKHGDRSAMLIVVALDDLKERSGAGHVIAGWA